MGGQLRQGMRWGGEVKSGWLPTRPFINERLTFTHGMGLTLGPVNQVTSEGLPVLFIKDLPPASSVSVRVTRPELYFGELTHSWVFARTQQPEFDYPSAEQNIDPPYTAPSRATYAEPLHDDPYYMTNSLKVVIEAFDRSVKSYLAAPRDPLVRTLAKAFPGIFQPLEAMSADLRAHLRYPEDLFRVQTDLDATYHMAEPDVFYHREDQWQKPVVSRSGERTDPFLRHIVMRLPEERQAEYLLMVPFTPRGKDNLASWMVARNDGAHYGQLVLYRFPKQNLVYGPTQIVNRINQDTDISAPITLWDQPRSQVIRGNLLVIPIEESLIYVQPLYLRAEGGRIPEMKRVVVAYQNRVVMEETLEAGVARLFAGAVPPRPAAPASPAATPRRAAPPAH